MQGPQDSGISATPALVGASATAGERRRPPGGKALLRLLQLLESRGFTETAEEVVDAAISDEHKEEFRIRQAAFTATPRNGPDGGASERRRTRASLREAAAGEPDAGEAVTDELVTEYLRVGQELAGPPGPGPQWRSIGPYTIPNGQTYGASRVNVSGRVAAIAVDPHDPAHVLCGAANGGVWESHDRGASWAPRTDYQATLAVGAIAFDPTTPSTVYCGTGEGNW